MKRFIGHVIALIGAHLWENGGYDGDGRYEDLKVTGKLGYKMFTMGLDWRESRWTTSKIC